nr:proliferating cell nuclear antigen [Cryptomonas curvata]
MFEVRLNQSGQLKKIIEAIKDIVCDVNFDCNNQGLSLQAMDQAHVSLVTLILKPEAFEYFRCDKSITLGINLLSLYKILKCSSNEDSVTISCKESLEILSFLFESPTNDRISEFQLKLIHINTEQLGIPDTDYPTVEHLTSIEYRRICSDLSILGDTIQIEVSKIGIKFEIEGDIGKGSIILRRSKKSENNEESINFLNTESVKMTFALRYLNNFSKATPLCDKIILKMGKDMPLQLEFKIGLNGCIRYYLAPKMDDI